MFLKKKISCIRFYSDGRVMMVVSNNPPAKIVRKLQLKEKLPFNVCTGYYQLSGNQLFLRLDKERDWEFNKKVCWENNTQRKTTYNMVCYCSKHGIHKNIFYFIIFFRS